MDSLGLKPRRSVDARVALIACGAFLASCATATEQPSQETAAHPIAPTSINALMVYLVDPAAHEIWDRNYGDEPLTDHDWMLVEQHASNLAASALLVSLGGTGQADQTWVRSPEWQRLTAELQTGALQARAAAESKDQAMLDQGGDAILETCISCHQAFKPDVPTEGIMHIPHGSPDFGG